MVHHHNITAKSHVLVTAVVVQSVLLALLAKEGIDAETFLFAVEYGLLRLIHHL